MSLLTYALVVMGFPTVRWNPVTWTEWKRNQMKVLLPPPLSLMPFTANTFCLTGVSR